MKFRAICLGLVALVFTTSGCLPYHNHPCWGFRLHPCSTGGGGGCGVCAPVCSSPIHHPILHKFSVGAPGCSTCVGGGPIITQPISYPIGTNPPVIGQPNPLQGPSIIPSRELPNPMPVKQSGY
jgi:hypothetical protein